MISRLKILTLDNHMSDPNTAETRWTNIIVNCASVTSIRPNLSIPVKLNNIITNGKIKQYCGLSREAT